MGRDLQERSQWLARNVLPHEHLLRAKLRDIRIHDLDMEDVIQETYTRMLSVESLETIRFPKQYALQTARAIVFDHIRHSRVVSIAYSGSLDALDVAEPEVGAEQRVEFQQEVLAVNRALARLPKLWREVLILRRVEGLSQKEVSSRLGISERTVEKYVGNGARLLARVFSRGGKGPTRTSNTTNQTAGNVGFGHADDQPGH
jgi:RNA polymerase sigma-70 factor (ECF subfamily)